MQWNGRRTYMQRPRTTHLLLDQDQQHRRIYSKVVEAINASHAYRDLQMIILGGELQNPAQAFFNASACDHLYPTIELLDTTS